MLYVVYGLRFSHIALVDVCRYKEIRAAEKAEEQRLEAQELRRREEAVRFAEFYM